MVIVGLEFIAFWPSAQARANTAVSGTPLANRRDVCPGRQRVEGCALRQLQPATGAARPLVKPISWLGVLVINRDCSRTSFGSAFPTGLAIIGSSLV